MYYRSLLYANKVPIHQQCLSLGFLELTGQDIATPNDVPAVLFQQLLQAHFIEHFMQVFPGLECTVHRNHQVRGFGIFRKIGITQKEHHWGP